MEMSNSHVIGSKLVGEFEATPPRHSTTIRGQNLFERFQNHNRDNWWRYREDIKSASDSVDNTFRRHTIKALASQLELPQYQYHRAFVRFMKLDISKIAGNVAVHAFVICAIVANNEAEATGGSKVYHPQRNKENNDSLFNRIHTTLTEDRMEFPCDDPQAWFNRWNNEDLVCSPVDEDTITKIYNKHVQGDLPTRPKQRWQSFVQGELAKECSRPQQEHETATMEPSD
jgi:hypothetical protein